MYDHFFVTITQQCPMGAFLQIAQKTKCLLDVMMYYQKCTFFINLVKFYAIKSMGILMALFQLPSRLCHVQVFDNIRSCVMRSWTIIGAAMLCTQTVSNLMFCNVMIVQHARH